MINWHALTGSYRPTTGHIHENGGKWLHCNFQEGKPHHSDSASWPWPTR